MVTGSCVIRETTQTGCPRSRPRISLSIYLYLRDLLRGGQWRWKRSACRTTNVAACGFMCQPVINRAWRLRSMTTAARVWERRSGHAGQRIPDPSAIRGRRRMACKIRRHSWPLRKMPPLADGHFHARAVRQSLCLARGFEVRECARESAQTTVDPAAIPSSAKHIASSALVQARKPRTAIRSAIQRYSDTAITTTFCSRYLYTLGPALRIPDINNMGRDYFGSGGAKKKPRL